MFDFFNNFFFGIGFQHSDIFEDYKIKREWGALTIFYTLVSIVMDSIKLGLDKTMNERYMKLCLITEGRAIISRIKDYKFDENGDVMNLCVTDENNMSAYGLPLNCGVTDYSGKAYERLIPYKGDNEEYANAVVVYWKEEDIPPICRIIKTANRLLELDCQISAAITNLKATVVVRCEKEQEKVVKKAWEESGKGLPVIITYNGSSDFGAQPELLVNNMSGDILKQLLETYDKTICDFCEYFGINSNNVVNKLSGVSDMELSQNMELVQVNKNAIINSIQKGLDDANRMFGTHLTVDSTFENIYTGNSEEERRTEDDTPDEENI